MNPARDVPEDQGGARAARRGGGKTPYFGWRIVAALSLVELAIFGVSLYAFIIIAQPLSASFGWSQAQSGALVSAMWLAAPLALVAAPYIERFGAWRAVILGVCLQAAAIALLGHVTSFSQLYLLRIVMGIGKVTAVTAMPIIIARWFSRRFATAIAIVWAGSSAGGVLMAPIADWVIATAGWRTAAPIFAAMMLATIPIVLLLNRGAGSPGDLNLELDGGAPGAAIAEEAPRAQRAQARPGVRAVLRPADWWAVLAILPAVVGTGMGIISIQSLLPSLTRTAGHSASAGAAMLGLSAGLATVGSASIGWLLDRYRSVWCSLLVGVAIFSGLGGLGLMALTGELGPGMFGAVSTGYAVGAIDVLWITLTRRQFGPAAFPMVYGCWYFSLQVGYALGGGVGGWLFERFGALGFVSFAALLYIPAVTLSFRRPGLR